jgi:hypothetical protein
MPMAPVDDAKESAQVPAWPLVKIATAARAGGHATNFQRNQRPGKEATRPQSRDGHEMN